MSQAISALCQFFSREIPFLSCTYNWKIPPIAGFDKTGHVGYQANIELKAHLRKQWNDALNDDKLQIAKIIVNDWGGVRANHPKTLERYAKALLEPEPSTPLKGVASYSKIFSIVDPSRFAIYDARVAACLNAVQINAGVKRGIAFNYVPGRNNVVGNALTGKGFTQNFLFSPKKLVSSGWLPVERDKTYETYIDLLKICLSALPSFDIVSLEMALFANAESECLFAMK